MRDQTVVIVGGTSGIGLATAQLVHEQGGFPIVMGRREESVQDAVSRLGQRAKGIVGDAGDDDAIRKLLESTDRVDHLLITTGSFLGDPSLDLEESVLREGMESRFWVAVRAVRAALPRLRPGGSVVFVSGIANYRPEGSPVALASGGAVESFTRGMAVKYAPLRFNCIAPGFIRTPFLEGLFGGQTSELLDQVAAATPLRRLGRPEEIADAIVFLMRNEFVTGITLTVDGGYLLT